MTPLDYWLEALQCSADARGIELTTEHAKLLAKDLVTSHECYGQAFGHECIPNPQTAELFSHRAAHAKKLAELEHREELLKASIAARYNTPVWVTIRDGNVCVEAQR